MCSIYKITNLINNKVYIGKQAKDDATYFGSGLLIKRAISKYGINNFIKEIIDTADTIDKLNEKEKYWIKEYNSIDNKVGYNIMSGGDGGDNFTNHPDKEEIRKRYSHKGKDNAMYGKKHTKESKEKISKNKKGQGRGVLTWNAGLKFNDYTEEHKKQLLKSYAQRKGAGNVMAKEYKIISPEGIEYFINGTLNDFCKEHNFFSTTVRYFFNKGIIPESNRKCTQERKNLTGWQIEII